MAHRRVLKESPLLYSRVNLKQLTASYQAMTGARKDRKLSWGDVMVARELARGSYVFLCPDGQGGSSEVV